MLTEYTNEPLMNFALSENKTAMESALALVAAQKGQHYPLVVGGEKIDTEARITSLNPSNIQEIVGTTARANTDLAEKAIQTALQAFASWKNVCPTERARYLFKAAAVMRRQKFEFSAWMVEEAGKTWPEADADTAEAIDFLEYYGRQMLDYAQGMPVVKLTGEESECRYIAIGVGVIIPPWNFPAGDTFRYGRCRYCFR